MLAKSTVKPGRLVDLFHMPNKRHYELFKDASKKQRSYPRQNLVLVVKSEPLKILFSGKTTLRDKLLLTLYPLARNSWRGGQEESGFAGVVTKPNTSMEAVRMELQGLSSHAKEASEKGTKPWQKRQLR